MVWLQENASLRLDLKLITFKDKLQKLMRNWILELDFSKKE